MSTEQNKALLRRLYEELFNRGNLNVVDELIAPDAVEHEEAPGLEGTAQELAKQFVTMLRTGFPDLRATVEDMIAEGDKVVAHITLKGTHQGEFLNDCGTAGDP